MPLPTQVHRLWQVDEHTGTVCIDITEDEKEYVAILANPLKARTRAKLQIMSVVEEKMKGEYTEGVGNKKSPELGWGEDTFLLEKDERNYVRDRTDAIENASGCLIRVVGMVVFFVGSSEERANGRRYVKWLLQMHRGKLVLSSEDPELTCMAPKFHRNKDVMQMDYQQSLKRLESVYQCFVFVAYDAADSYKEKLFIAGHDPNLRRIVATEELPRMRTDHRNDHRFDHDKGKRPARDPRDNRDNRDPRDRGAKRPRY
eukprot:TRINITY_DN9708_c0_g1_i2.p1 TRINITY_DN9708_c0_g1~~TRINITY_DN9708_c0_g1_i2.p1  ORF type:complete len:258 (+),score=97.67 TRINITY_DN9708_c0_g1_i2:230-1003(+)